MKIRLKLGAKALARLASGEEIEYTTADGDVITLGIAERESDKEFASIDDIFNRLWQVVARRLEKF
jgi:hypothetical protein